MPRRSLRAALSTIVKSPPPPPLDFFLAEAPSCSPPAAQARLPWLLPLATPRSSRRLHRTCLVILGLSVKVSLVAALGSGFPRRSGVPAHLPQRLLRKCSQHLVFTPLNLLDLRHLSGEGCSDGRIHCSEGLFGHLQCSSSSRLGPCPLGCLLSPDPGSRAGVSRCARCCV